MPEEKQADKQAKGGPIVPTTELESAHKSGEAAQEARRGEKPAQKTSPADFEIMSSSGSAAQDRRKGDKK
jgi:hypothetical protein